MTSSSIRVITCSCLNISFHQCLRRSVWACHSTVIKLLSSNLSSPKVTWGQLDLSQIRLMHKNAWGYERLMCEFLIFIHPSGTYLPVSCLLSTTWSHRHRFHRPETSDTRRHLVEAVVTLLMRGVQYDNASAPRLCLASFLGAGKIGLMKAEETVCDESNWLLLVVGGS